MTIASARRPSLSRKRLAAQFVAAKNHGSDYLLVILDPKAEVSNSYYFREIGPKEDRRTVVERINQVGQEDGREVCLVLSCVEDFDQQLEQHSLSGDAIKLST